MGLLDHVALSIIRGVGKTVGDLFSAEADPVVLDLWSDASAFSLIEWSPNIPSLKGNGLWADSPISDGRTLISGVNTNVTETMTVNLTGSTAPDFAAQFKKLQLMVQDARDFWDEFGQIEPVYIRWWASGAPGPQFALIYNIDMDVEFQDGPMAQARITLTIEREYGWRGVRPGGNPKEWAIENVFNNQIFNSANASLMSGVDFLLYETGIANRAEQNSAQTGYTVKNFVDIPAVSIPGDLPALLCLQYVGTTLGATIDHTGLIVSKSTKKNTGNVSRRTTTNQYLIHVLNAADASVQTDTTLAADTGASTGISALQRRSNTTFATATLIPRLAWSSNNYTANGFDLSVLRGRYVVFCRARLSAAATTVNLQLGVYESQSVNPVTLDPVVFTNQGSAGTGNTTEWGVAYLGQIDLPVSDRKTAVSGNGMGIAVDLGASQLPIQLTLNASRTAGAGVLYVNDLLFMPIDEGSVNIISTIRSVALAGGGGITYDNTGYLRHGMPGDYVNLIGMSGGVTPFTEYDILQLSGSPIYLTPGVDNRLEFFAYAAATTGSQVVYANNTTVKASIVPRWSGLRDK